MGVPSPPSIGAMQSPLGGEIIDASNCYNQVLKVLKRVTESFPQQVRINDMKSTPQIHYKLNSDDVVVEGSRIQFILGDGK